MTASLAPAPRPAAGPFVLRRPLPAVALLAGVLFLLWLRFYQPPNTVDDAYITFRYARNIATGVGFVYNPGEHVLGTTTPAYALLLAAAAWLSGIADYPWLALVVNALINALTFAVIVRLTYRLTGRLGLGLGAALLFSIEGRGLDFSTAGMEAGFNQLAVLSTFLLLFERRTRWAAVMLGLAVLIRPDGINLAAAFFGVLGLEKLRRPRQWPWVEAALFAAVVAPWLIFATLYFGNFIPQSILAKSELYRTPALMALRAFLVQARALWPFSLPGLTDHQSLGRELAQFVFPAAAALLGLWAAQRRQPRAYAIGVYMALFITFYSIGNPLWLGWYEIPLFPLYHILFITAAAWVGGQAAAGMKQPTARSGLAYGLAAVTVAVLAVPHLSRLNLVPGEDHPRAAWVLNPAFNKRREADYQLLARMLQPAAAHDRLVAIPEIGAFGYTYGGRLFDTAGLISPRTNDYYPIPAEIPFEIYAVPRRLIFDLQPDLFISFDSMLVGDLQPGDTEFLRDFPPTIGMVSHAAFGIQRLMVYRRAANPIEVRLPAEAVPAEISYAGGLVALRGYELRAWSDPATNYIEVTLFWEAGEAPVNRELLARVNLNNAAGETVFQVLDYPGETLFPTASWTPGMWLVDRYELKRPAGDAGPFAVTLTLFASDADAPLEAVSAGGRPAEDTLVIPVGAEALGTP
ncbi:MAG: hypothetical protein IT317_04915 [Anaerolineales bacterium]|nr:hypothetical protein [Anaerolineales bacterium]